MNLIPAVNIEAQPSAAAVAPTATHFLVMRKHAVTIDPLHPVAPNERLMVSAEAYELQGARLKLISDSLFQTSNTAELMCLERNQARMESADLASKVNELQQTIHNLERQLHDRSRP